MPGERQLCGNTEWLICDPIKEVLPADRLSRRKMVFSMRGGKCLRGEFKQVVDELALSGRTVNCGASTQIFVRKLVLQ